MDELTQDQNSVANKSKFSVNNWDLFWIISLMVQRLIGIVFNIYLAVNYFLDGFDNYCIWTVCCMVIPMIITTTLYVHMFFQDKTDSKLKDKNTLNIIIYVIILPLLFRYTKSFYYCIMCRKYEKYNQKEKQKNYYKRMIREESDIALLRIFECFLEVAPQKILQMSIAIRQMNIYLPTLFSILQCFISLSWCMVTYHRYNRFAQADKENISINGLVLQICWHFCVSVSRIFCIVMFILISPLWTLVASLIHALLGGLTLLVFMTPIYCSNSIISSFMFCLILGAIYIFIFIMPKEGHSRIPFTIYYLICFVEEVLLTYLFFKLSKGITHDLVIFFCTLPVLLYCMGIIFMLIYYLRFHPRSKNNPQIIISRNFEL